MVRISHFLTLNEIYKDTRNDIISLPTVQRGFVWKPYQIENLWDSLLRGYPIGAFVLSPKRDAPDQYELLDGQQRASAICLGYYNPLKDVEGIPNSVKKFFHISTDSIMIFVDLVKLSSENDNRKYLFRVITKSHPWGYRLKENHKILRSNVIAKARDAYELRKSDYLKKPLNLYWPYDAYKPIPIGIFIDAANQNKSIFELKEEIAKWQKGKTIRVLNSDNKDIQYYSIEEIYTAVKNMLYGQNNQRIPVLHFDIRFEYDNSRSYIKSITVDAQQRDDEDASEDADLLENEIQPNVEERETSEIENLFIRLNAGGTPLRGEELNYSILKAHITRDTQEKIESKCKGMFNPARFITIAFRLFNCSRGAGVYDRDSITMRINPKQFQRRIQAEQKPFIDFIETSFLNTDILDNIRNFLTYDPINNDIGLPSLIVNSLSDRAPEVIFMLLYRILIKRDVLDNKLKKHILGMLTILTWLGRGEKQRDYSKLLNTLWPCLRDFNAKRFWLYETIQRCLIHDDSGYEILTPFPPSSQLKRLIPNEDDDIRKSTWDNLTGSESQFGNFIKTIFYEKELVLYAQRDMLYEWFGGIDIYELDDTNRAFDWDHICPLSAIYKKKYIHSALKDWYSSNGNIRAWPFDLNRGDSDKPPSCKLVCTDADVSWLRKRLKCKTQQDINDRLLKFSICNAEWLNIDENCLQNIRDTGYAKRILNCILERNISHCREWYNNLGIDSYFSKKMLPKDICNFFLSKLDKRVWKRSDVASEDNRRTFELSLYKENIYLYLDFDVGADVLKDNNVEYGIMAYSKSEKKYLPLSIRLTRRKENEYKPRGAGVIYGEFTLLSFSDDSLIGLYRRFVNWLVHFPNKDIGRKSLKIFRESIKVQDRDLIFGNM